MSKSLQKPNQPTEFVNLRAKLESLERSWIIGNILFEVDTTGLSNAEIDLAITSKGAVGPPGTVPNGKMISDPTNKLLLVRQENTWRKVSVT